MAQVICRTCGFAGNPDRFTEGSILIELVLWFTFLIPGVLYSIWRLTTRRDVCAKCKSGAIIPLDTPMGRKLLGELRPTKAKTEDPVKPEDPDWKYLT